MRISLGSGMFRPPPVPARTLLVLPPDARVGQVAFAGASFLTVAYQTSGHEGPRG